MSYLDKYLKYKTKYMELKELMGGDIHKINETTKDAEARATARQKSYDTERKEKEKKIEEQTKKQLEDEEKKWQPILDIMITNPKHILDTNYTLRQLNQLLNIIKIRFKDNSDALKQLESRVLKAKKEREKIR